jgi:hypothetical protein
LGTVSSHQNWQVVLRNWGGDQAEKTIGKGEKVLVQKIGHPFHVATARFNSELPSKTAPSEIFYDGFCFSGILVKNEVPAILTLFVFQKVDIVVVGLDLEIDRTFTIPAVHHLFYLVLAVVQPKSMGSFVSFMS